MSLRLDSLGKSMGSAIMRMKIHVEDDEIEKPKVQALQNLTVLDLTRVVAGPYAGAILGDFGAKVIKIEVPGKGDDARGYGPYANGESMYYANLNRYKLDTVAKALHVSLENHHRAVDDAEATAGIFLRFVENRLSV